MSNDELPDPLATAADTSPVTVLERFGELGWSENHLAQPGGGIRCGSCTRTNPAAEYELEARHRVEGASDPADMQLVVGVCCPNCAARGALVASYGPGASEQDREVVTALRDGDVHDPLATDD